MALILGRAVRDQSVEHAPLVIFALVAAVTAGAHDADVMNQ